MLAMCGRFVQLPAIDFGQPGLAELVPGLADIQPSYNLVPTQRASVILDRGEGRQVSESHRAIVRQTWQLATAPANSRAYIPQCPPRFSPNCPLPPLILWTDASSRMRQSYRPSLEAPFHLHILA